MSSSLYRRLHSLFIKPTTSTTTTVSKPKTSKTTTTTTTTTISKPKTKPTTTTATISEPKTSKPTATKEQKLKRLVKQFKKASNDPNFRNRRHHYKSTVLRLAKANQFSLISQILDHQKRFTDITNEKFAVRLISLYGKSGMFDHAQKLFDEMPHLHCGRTVLSFNALLAACVHSKRFDKISEHFQALPEKLSIEPDQVSYNIVIKAFCEMGSWDSAVVVIDEMVKNGVEPNVTSFNTLLNAFYKNNRFSDAEKMWDLMEKKNVVPDVRSYNAKLQCLVGENQFLEAVDLVEEMGRKGVKPNAFSFSALIKGFCDDGNLEEAKKWYKKIAENDCVPDKFTFIILIPFVCDKGDFEFGLELCKEAIGQSCVIYTATLQRVVDGLVEKSMVQEAKEFVELGRSNHRFHYNLKLPTDE